jgi:hypothetical protein
LLELEIQIITSAFSVHTPVEIHRRGDLSLNRILETGDPAGDTIVLPLTPQRKRKSVALKSSELNHSTFT